MDIGTSKSSFIAFFPISYVTRKGLIKMGRSFPGLSFTYKCFVERSTYFQGGYWKIFSHCLHMLYPSLPGLAASIVVLTTLIVTPAHSPQLLAYMYFAVSAMPHLLEASTSYHVLSHKAISQYVTKALH